MEYRIEHDSLGDKKTPKDAYYGIHSLRAKENFDISGLKINPKLIRAFAHVKKACARANYTADLITEDQAKAIIQACEDLAEGKLDKEIIIDPIQGGGGTSTNMNFNEVIANRANEIIGEDLGSYTIHPIDHVNKSQSTNDVYGTSGKIATIYLFDELLAQIEKLIGSFNKKSEEFKDTIKMGRTQLQDAVPVTLGLEFSSFSNLLARDLKRIEAVREKLEVVNLGGTAIGTSVNVSKEYYDNVLVYLREITGLDLKRPDNMVDATAHMDAFADVSSVLKSLAINLSKIANDIRLLSSGPVTMVGDINIPSKQAGSSIMPGKVNPVIPEVVNQVAFKVIGNDTTITMAIEGGQLQLNAFEPIMFHSVFESIVFLTNTIDTFIVNCVDGITANEEKMQKDVENSTGMITLLVPEIGYDKSAELVKEAVKQKKSASQILKDNNILSSREIDDLIDKMLDTLK